MLAPSYSAITVTLTEANTKYSLLSLLEAVETVLPTARQINLQADKTNESSAVLVGDAKLSTTRFGYALLSAESRQYLSDMSNVFLGMLWVQSPRAGAKLNVEVMGF